MTNFRARSQAATAKESGITIMTAIMWLNPAMPSLTRKKEMAAVTPKAIAADAIRESMTAVIREFIRTILSGEAALLGASYPRYKLAIDIYCLE